jgi:hypothetical protein
MRRLVVVALFALLFSAAPCFAAGGPCPTGATYGPNSNATLASMGVTSCFFVAATGSDTNTGTSEAIPWLHAPGMINCASNCKITPASGTGIIFHGGDTWHFGNSSLSPYAGTPAGSPTCGVGGTTTCSWEILSSGTSSNPIYWGVDQTWFNAAVCGASWCRPIMNADNPLSTTGVTSCMFPQGTFVMFAVNFFNFNQVDNMEFTGLCWNGNQSNSNEHICCATFLNSSAGQNTLSNLYIHGWTHPTFSCSMSGGEPTGNCDGTVALQGVYITYNNVIDGADTDGVSLTGIFGDNTAGSAVFQNVIRNLANGMITAHTHDLHSNLFERMSQSGDGVSHTNGYEYNAEPASDNVVYNNVLRNIFLVGSGEVQQMAPVGGFTDYYFNNILYAISSNAQYFDLCASGSGSGCGSTGYTINIFNNTWVFPATIAAGGVPPLFSGSTVNFINNHCLFPGGGVSTACVNSAGILSQTTNIVQDTLLGATCYNASETFAYSPTASNCATAGAGTNEQSLCSALTGSADPVLQAAGTACMSDTGYACAYNTANHSVSCPARPVVARPTGSANWDVGAYQVASAPPNMPSGLAATPH